MNEERENFLEGEAIGGINRRDDEIEQVEERLEDRSNGNVFTKLSRLFCGGGSLPDLEEGMNVDGVGSLGALDLESMSTLAPANLSRGGFFSRVFGRDTPANPPTALAPANLPRGGFFSRIFGRDTPANPPTAPANPPIAPANSPSAPANSPSAPTNHPNAPANPPIAPANSLSAPANPTLNVLGRIQGFFSRFFNCFHGGVPATAADDNGGYVWKTFVEQSHEFIRWIVGTVFLFVPAQFFIEGDDQNPNRQPSNSFLNEVQSRFPEYFLPTALLYIGFYLGSLFFIKKPTIITFQCISLFLGWIAVIQTVIYVGFETSKFFSIAFVCFLPS